MLAELRRSLRAAWVSGALLALLDAALAYARARSASPALALSLFAGVPLASFTLSVLGVGVVAGHRALAPRLRPLFAALCGGLGGLALGLALFSGSGVQRLGLRLPLTLASVLVSIAVAVWATRASWRPSSRLAGALALGLYGVHATVLVRQYPLLHALLALSVVGLGAWAARCAAPASRRWGVAPLVAVAAVLVATRTQAVRSALRSHAPLGQYLARVALPAAAPSRMAPRAPARLIASGPRLPLAGRDIILVTVDALRADVLRANGGRGRMPNADRLAASGLNFRGAYCSTPHTSYSLASLMLGAHARAVLALSGGVARLTLAQHLAAQGYSTAAFYPPAVFSVDRSRFGALATAGFGFAFSEERHADASELVRRAMAWLSAKPRSERVFLWVHFFEPHERYEVHPGLEFGPDPRSRYESECAYVDGALAQLRASVRETGREVAWVLSADHGEEFGEHGGAFHGTSVYGEQVRVPLLIEVPGLRGRAIDTPVSLVDLAPTILAGVGLTRPERMTGENLGPLVFGLRWDRPVFSETGSLRRVTLGREALIADLDDGTLELFDLDRDPLERANLADGRAERAAALRDEITRWEEANARAEAAGSAEEVALPVVLQRAMQGERALAPEVAALAADRARDTGIRLRALDVLASLDVRSDAVRALIAPLAEGGSALATRAGLTLALLGDPRGLAGAIRAYESANGAARTSAALALARLGDPRGVDELGAAMNDPQRGEGERDAAVEALSSLRDPRSFAHWERLLSDPRLAPRAAEALGALGDRRAIAVLRGALSGMRYPLTVRATLGALAALGDPDAAQASSEALGRGDAIPDVFALLRVMSEPGRAVVGRRRVSSIAAGRSRSLKVGRGAGAWPPLRRIYLRLRATDEGTVRVAEQVEIAVREGTHEYAVELPTPLEGHRVRVSPSVDLRVLGIAAR